MITTLYRIPIAETKARSFMQMLLLHITPAKKPTVTTLINYLRHEYHIDAVTAQHYAELAHQLLLWEYIDDPYIRLTELGETYVHASTYERWNQILAWQLLTRCIGAPLVLMLYEVASTPLHMDRAVEIIQQNISELHDREQIVNRIHWLEALDCLLLAETGYGQITRMGRDLLNDYTASSDRYIQDIRD